MLRRLPDQATIRMPFPPLKIETAHGVIGVQLDEPQPRTKEASDALIAALRADFPSSVQQIPVQAGAPAEVPHLVLQSKSSHVLFSRVQADFEARFFGTHEADPEQCRGFVAEKMSALLAAWESGGAQPVMTGMIVTLHFVMPDDSDTPAVQHVLGKQLSADMSNEAVNEAKVQLGLRLHDHFFVTIGIGTYEGRQVNRAIVPGVSTAVIRPWDAELVEEGIEVTVDVNNRLRPQVEKKHTRVDQNEMLRVNNLAWDIVKRIAVPLARDGVLDISMLEQAVA
jgi:hypothetical protein